MEVTPEQLAEKFNKLATQLPEAVEFAIDAGLVELDAQFSNRVWNLNEDVNGNKFGKYKSKSYADYRSSLGRQTTDKDLQLFGDLKRSIAINYEEKALVFTNDESELIADGQERQMNKIIFESSREEKDIVLDVIGVEFTKFTKEKLQGS